MEFVFKAQEPSGIDVEVFVYSERVSVGRLLFTLEEWNIFRAMLKHGNRMFQDGEGHFAIEERSAVPVFLEGVQ